MYAKSETLIEVRYYETDMMGIVHHSNYIRYFECGRSRCLVEAGLPIEKIEEMGIELPVVSVECKYKTPAVMGDILRVVTIIEKEPQARLEILNEIYNQRDELVCFGKVVLGFLNKETHRPTRVPKFFMDAFHQSINL